MKIPLLAPSKPALRLGLAELLSAGAVCPFDGVRAATGGGLRFVGGRHSRQRGASDPRALRVTGFSRRR
jgi:hypothetical protein